MADYDKYLRAPAQPLLTTNLRFLGFVNDVGEALQSFLPRSLYVRCSIARGPQARLRGAPVTLSPLLPPALADWQLRRHGRLRAGGRVL